MTVAASAADTAGAHLYSFQGKVIITGGLIDAFLTVRVSRLPRFDRLSSPRAPTRHFTAISVTRPL